MEEASGDEGVQDKEHLGLGVDVEEDVEREIDESMEPESGDEGGQENENSDIDEDEDVEEEENVEDEDVEEEELLEDEDSLVPGAEDDLLSDESNSLYDQPNGFCDPENIETPLGGFSDEDRNRIIFPLIIPLIILYQTVQELETANLKSSEQALLLHKNPVAIPSNRLAITNGGPEIKLQIIDTTGLDEPIIQREVPMASVPEQAPEKLLTAILKDVFPSEEELLEDEDSLVPGAEDDLLSDESNSLYDQPNGFCDPENIKTPLAGFSDRDQNRIFPLVYQGMVILCETLKELETANLKSSEQALLLHKNPVAVPSNRLAITNGGPEIKLRIIDTTGREESIIQREVSMASVPEQVPEKLVTAIKLIFLQEAIDKGQDGNLNSSNVEKSTTPEWELLDSCIQHSTSSGIEDINSSDSSDLEVISENIFIPQSKKMIDEDDEWESGEDERDFADPESGEDEVPVYTAEDYIYNRDEESSESL